MIMGSLLDLARFYFLLEKKKKKIKVHRSFFENLSPRFFTSLWRRMLMASSPLQQGRGGGPALAVQFGEEKIKH